MRFSREKISEFEWLSNPTICYFFMRLLLKANYKDDRWQGIEVKRGQLLTGRKSLSIEFNLTERQIRTCLDKLTNTGYIVQQTTNKYTIITICDYDSWQELSPANDQQSVTQATSERPTNDQQTTTSKEYNKNKEEKEESPNGDNGKKAVGKKKKRTNEEPALGEKARRTFVEYYDSLSISDEPYYWTGKDAGHMKMLLDKIRHSRKSRGLEIDDDSMIFALNAFLNSISDQWILQHFEPATINSKYNEIVANAKKANEMPQFPPNPKHGDTIGYDWFYDAYDLHRWIKDREEDDQGRMFSVQNGRWLK